MVVGQSAGRRRSAKHRRSNRIRKIRKISIPQPLRPAVSGAGSTFAILAAGVFTVAWAAPLIRLATQAPPLVIAFWRTAIAGLVLVAFTVLFRRSDLKALSARDLGILFVSGLFLAVHFAAWIASIDMTSIASSVLLVASQPVIVGLLSGFFGEGPGSRGWLGIGIASAGALIVAAGDFASSGVAGRGDLLALLGAAGGAGYFLIGRRVRVRISVNAYASVVYCSCAGVLLLVVTLLRQPLTGYSAATMGFILLIAAGPQLLGHTTLNFLLARLEATKVVLAMMGEPLGAVIIALFLFKELPGLAVIPGGLLILAGIAIFVWSSRTAEVAPISS